MRPFYAHVAQNDDRNLCGTRVTRFIEHAPPPRFVCGKCAVAAIQYSDRLCASLDTIIEALKSGPPS